MAEKIVLAYSGGLDTSVAVDWLHDRLGYDVIALTVDVGNDPDMDAIVAKAKKIGAVDAFAIDARDEFMREFVFPALQADAVYESAYPLATALARPLIARHLVDVARREGAKAVAHGCTGKGNDQVRFDLAVGALAPELKIVAPARDWEMTREDAIAYAEKRGIPVPTKRESPYSIDVNLWGRSVEAGVLEDPWIEPPADAFAWTAAPEEAPDAPEYVEISFKSGIPLALNGVQQSPVDLAGELTRLGGRHGVGRIDHVENRLVGIKSREVYEAPAAAILLSAHQALESLTLAGDQMAFKAKVANELARQIYNGLWFGAHVRDLLAYVASTQAFVRGEVRVKLHKGNCSVVGRRSPYSLYDVSLATYGEGDAFDQKSASGFIDLFGLQLRTQARVQPHDSRSTRQTPS